MSPSIYVEFSDGIVKETAMQTASLLQVSAGSQQAPKKGRPNSKKVSDMQLTTMDVQIV